MADEERATRLAFETDQAAAEWRDSNYFAVEDRDSFASTDGRSALHELMTDGADPARVEEEMAQLREQTGATDALLELSTLYFKMAAQGDSAGDGILMSRALQEVLSREGNESISLRSIWHEICLLRSLDYIQKLIERGDKRIHGLTYPLDTDEKLNLFDRLVEGCTKLVEAKDEGFERFKLRCLGVLAEYAAGAAIHEASESFTDKVSVFYPRGKGLGSIRPHEEEGQGVDWVVTTETSTGSRRVLLVQVKAFAFSDRAWVYQPIRSKAELERALVDLQSRQLVYRQESQRLDKMDELVHDVRHSMEKLLQYASHGEVPVLCILPSLPINADTDRNADYYSQRSGKPTDQLTDQARQLLAKQGLNY